MKIKLSCTQYEFEKAKEAYDEGEFPCKAVHCPFGADADETNCTLRCPLTWRNREDQLIYLEHHIEEG